MRHGLAGLVLVLCLGGCRKAGGPPSETAPAARGEEGEAAATEGGEATPATPATGAGETPATPAGGVMSVAEFCKTFGEKAQKEGGKAADFWNRNLGKDCEKDLGDEKKKKGDDKWKAFVDCANSKATAADALDECEL